MEANEDGGRLARWTQSHHGLAYDVMRIYLGVALFVRGIIIVSNPSTVVELITSGEMGWVWPMLIAHYVALAHLGGGFFLAAGLLTRVAALVQLPVLVGALVFVHAGEGLLAPSQSFELAALVLTMLTVYAVFGAGAFSLDAYTQRKAAESAVEDSPGLIAH